MLSMLMVLSTSLALGPIDDPKPAGDLTRVDVEGEVAASADEVWKAFTTWTVASWLKLRKEAADGCPRPTGLRSLGVIWPDSRSSGP